ncbi:V-type ATPase, V0 complex, 116kDa subunit family and ATPase, V0 complex, subunit 116kDa, eukaryotic family-containing protein [Strongyloides ratti]|uniref:V-type proton ATPase subunit a n=1 Tax=Strongyloides ratti TaxID=34506 RepID=A0A090L6L9_STRRB|nr:V-type ATPase, V0 complex, 116kDa subunit family and ATPase, V0 complex, subunit 116kDa, eukaryotic family-containing protein [Strongyloides ratti]CEF63733.1 V-type ATPase, V0 complex, 116kDa subunit family and ATPase, V0 complex, subunit 116kDa, eukaryotic family-containing protein [Strongyloides ratti]
MGSLYRSELMTFCELYLPSEAAYNCIAELGEFGLCQFKDLNESFNSHSRKFHKEISMCDEMERIVENIKKCLNEEGIKFRDIDHDVPVPEPKEFSSMHTKLTLIQNELTQVSESMNLLKKNYSELNVCKHVLSKVAGLVDSNIKAIATKSISEVEHGHAGPFFTSDDNVQEETSTTRDRDESELSFICGAINSTKMIIFEKLLWRMTRGKAYVRSQPIDDEANTIFPSENNKSAFVIFFIGKQLKQKIRKVCDAFHCNIVESPENPNHRRILLGKLETQISDLIVVINKTIEYKNRILFGTSQHISQWEMEVLKVKSVYNILNYLNVDVTHKCLIGELWTPTNEIENVKSYLRIGQKKAECTVEPILSPIHSHDIPPTYHKLNKFTSGFQNIVNSYGIAAYREINPAPWTIISFPFIFAIMFGDSGHGIIMLLCALSFVLFEQKIEKAKIKDEIFNTFYGGRYVVLLMSCFSIYTGFIYNDFYSKSVNIFGSSWKNPYNESIIISRLMDDSASLTLPVEEAFDSNYGPYPFGVDPIWNLATNKLTFLNTMKMKMSIIIGISQMAFGVVLSLVNYIHRKSLLDFFFMFIPQLLFLSCIFVYLCIQVIIKWIFFSVTPGFIFGQYYPSSNCAPSLLIGLINMFMLKHGEVGFVKDNNAHGKVYDQCYLQQWYPGQGTVETILLVIAVISIPVMLLAKPLIQLWMHKRGMKVSSGHGHDEEFSFGDVMVYQAIHTIEYALGCISHTASYLRLWALSLAHAQLSEVLWTMVLNMALSMSGYGGSAAIYFIFWAFSILSVAILVLMEGLSAFLHALRLHWVEFQSKFYLGTGIAFEPFSFVAIQKAKEGLD